jgi:hypothetical protein
MTSVAIGFAHELGVDKRLIQKFYQESWVREIALSNDDFYTWQFINAPGDNLDKCCVALHDGELVAVIGATERDFLLNECTLKGVELTTWMVKEGKRNLNIGQVMLDHIKSNFDVIFAMGISKSALPLYLTNNFKYIKAIPRFIKSINNKVIKKYGMISPEFKLISRIKSENLDYSVSDITRDLADDIFKQFQTDNNAFQRNFDWVNWRFLSHPSYDYNVKVVEDQNNNRCIAVFRVEDKEEFKIMHCVDLFGDSQAYEAALCYLEVQAKSLGVDVMDMYSTNTTVNACLMSRNWITTVDSDLVNFPHLFNPIEMRTPSTTSLIMWTSKEDSALLDFGKLYITKQDCDFDRPVRVK